MHVAGAEHDRRVDAHERQPARGDAHRLHLGLVHGVHVRDPEPPGGEELRLVGRPPGSAGPTAAALEV